MEFLRDWLTKHIQGCDKQYCRIELYLGGTGRDRNATGCDKGDTFSSLYSSSPGPPSTSSYRLIPPNPPRLCLYHAIVYRDPEPMLVYQYLWEQEQRERDRKLERLSGHYPTDGRSPRSRRTLGATLYRFIKGLTRHENS